MQYKQNMTDHSDRQLIAASLTGQTAAYGQLVERHWKMAVAMAITKIHDAALAEDIAQESFIKAYSNLNKLHHHDRFAAWLSKIVNQQCINHIRKSAKTKNTITMDTKTFETLNPLPALCSTPTLNENQIKFIRQTIANLPDKFKTVIIMRFIAGFSSAQIAKKLGKRHGTIRVRLHRAYQILKKELAPVFKEAD